MSSHTHEQTGVNQINSRVHPCTYVTEMHTNLFSSLLESVISVNVKLKWLEKNSLFNPQKLMLSCREKKPLGELFFA
jgi:hypothetical protein